MGFLLPDLPYLPDDRDDLVGVPERDGGDPMSSSPLRSSEPGTIGGIGRLSRPLLTDDEDDDEAATAAAARAVAEKAGLCSLLARLLLLEGVDFWCLVWWWLLLLDVVMAPVVVRVGIGITFI